MDATILQNRIYAGYGKAALRVGQDYSVYRPQSALLDAISPVNLIETIKASFNAQDMAYTKPNKFGQSLWYGIFDGRLVQVGDYLVGAGGTYFVAGMQETLPILVVQANCIVSIAFSTLGTGTGGIGYDGVNGASMTRVLTNRPASILQGGGGQRVDLPSDVKNPQWNIIIPHIAGLYIDTGYVMTDDLGRDYAVQSAELTDLGWRINASEIIVSKQQSLGAFKGYIA